VTARAGQSRNLVLVAIRAMAVFMAVAAVVAVVGLRHGVQEENGATPAEATVPS
jgi:hypothetical protein